jgi:5-methylcytosine-specific restriction endonuclease McrA
MEYFSNSDNQTIFSDLTTEQSESSENYDLKIDDIKAKLNIDLNKLNTDALKDKCKELGLTGTTKLKKPELIQLLENEFYKNHNIIKEKSKNELKNLCKMCDVKKISSAKKEYLVYQIIQYYANNMIFKIIQDTTDSTESTSTKEQPMSLIEQLEKQKQEIELKMQEEIKKQEAEAKRLAEEEKKRVEEERRKAEEEKKRVDDEEKKRIEEEEKKEAKRKKQTIPKNVRIIVWNHYIGEDIIKHKCLCCKKVTISNTNFEVGHVLSEKNGGTHEINNLRPICFACNHSMGAENMIDFVVKFGLYIG